MPKKRISKIAPVHPDSSLTYLNFSHQIGNGPIINLYKCNCGNEILLPQNKVNLGQIISCHQDIEMIIKPKNPIKNENLIAPLTKEKWEQIKKSKIIYVPIVANF